MIATVIAVIALAIASGTIGYQIGHIRGTMVAGDVVREITDAWTAGRFWRKLMDRIQ